MILSDLFTWGLYGVLSILTGLYLTEKLPGNVIEIVGFGIFLYFITRAVVNIPAGKLVDALPGNQDEAHMLFFGSLLMGAPFLFYPLIDGPLLYYLLQIVFGAGAALHIVSSKKLIAIHLDKNREGEEFSVYDSSYSIFIAITGLVGGMIASVSTAFFSLVFFGFGLMIISSGAWALLYLRMYYPERRPLLLRTLDYVVKGVRSGSKKWKH